MSPFPPIDHNAALLQAFRARIAELGLTQEEVDHQCGFTPRYVGRILRGEKHLTMRTMPKLLDVLMLKLNPGPR